LRFQQSPVFLLNSHESPFTAAQSPFPCTGSKDWAPLLPKLRGQFAEFLNESSLARLRIFSLPTCVGLRYGHTVHSRRGFSGQRSWAASPALRRTRARLSGLTAPRVCLGNLPTSLSPHIQTWAGLPFCVTPSLITRTMWFRNINRMSIIYALRPRLRTD
jgi:hypothetical protein